MNSEIRDDRFESTCLVVGQVMATVSSFFWLETGRHDAVGSVIIILSMVFWSAGMMGLFRGFSGAYAKIGLLYGLYGCLGGIGFGFEGLYSVVLGISDKIGVEAHAKAPMAMNLVLFWAGPAFPLTLMIWGVTASLKKVVPVWIGILFFLGGVLFPVSRILRIEWVAHVADVTLLVGVVGFSMRSFRGGLVGEEARVR